MNEAARLDSLNNLALETIAQPEVFSKITELAAGMFDCEISLISIVGAEDLWFLGKSGLELDRLPRANAFCSIAIMNEHPLLVNDALVDFRFRLNPLVVGQPHVRSYLGVPIRAGEGALIGTLCVIARQPNAFDGTSISQLKALAELTEQCLLVHAQTRELRSANISLSQLNSLFSQAEKAANVGAWRVDIATDELVWSDQVYAIHGIPRETEINVINAIGFYDDEGQKVVGDALFDALDRGEPFSFEANIRRADGKLRRVRAVGERVVANGKPDSIAGIILDCTEEHLKAVALKRAAERDSLTGLYNRAVFDRKLTGALSNHTDEPVTMMLLDLDGFKEVNDKLGHLVGDQVLAGIAEQLQREAGDAIFLARWGGDEFAFLFPPGTTLDDAVKFGERLLGRLSEQVVSGKEILIVGGTCGVSQLPAGGASAELVRRADLALYHGKSKEKASVIRWTEEIEDAQSARKEAIQTLESALRDDRAFPAYQPIIDLATDGIVGVEALLRLTDTDGRTISASEILPALLDPALAQHVSLLMLEKAFSEGPEVLDRFGENAHIGINVSSADLHRGDFADKVVSLATGHALNPRNLTIEVTEIMLLADHAGQVLENLKRLDAMGCTIALDDFGTGFSSLTHLRNFPISKVKIDKEFISTIGSDHQSRLIIQALVQMGQSLDMQVVAEGVETAEQVEFLKSIGCSHAQGYYFGKPVAVHDLPAAPFPASQNQRDAA